MSSKEASKIDITIRLRIYNDLFPQLQGSMYLTSYKYRIFSIRI